VLVDIVRSDRLPVKRLQRNHRNKGGVAALAAAIREGNPAANHEGDPAANREEDEERILDLLRSSDDLHWQEAVDKPSAVVDGWIAQWGSDLRRSAAAGDVAESLTTLNGLRVLCAHRRGPAGVATWAPLVIDRFGAGPGRWPLGQPMMITKNGIVPGLYNGDTGVIVRADTGVRVAFSDTIQVAPERLGSETQAAYALTTHKAQGSQFDKVVLVLPEPGSRILTRELLYTAVTRAKSEVAILGSQASLAAALTRRVGRATGLSERLS
jgi:exodeoxyribonuclease V alpha subunit